MLDGDSHASQDDRRRARRFALRLPRWQTWALAGALIASSGLLLDHIRGRHRTGCPAYTPFGGALLIGHAGGALPDRIYPNDVEALDRGYANGLRVFEIDFHELPFGGLRTGHDWSDVLDPRSAWFSTIATWFRAHPDARLVTDFKTDNISGLRRVAAAAPDLRGRIMPFAYHDRDFPAARALGFDKIIFTTHSNPDPDWLDYVDRHAFAAVAITADRMALIPRIRRPVLVHVLDAPPASMAGISGIITNCMVPPRRR